MLYHQLSPFQSISPAIRAALRVKHSTRQVQPRLQLASLSTLTCPLPRRLLNSETRRTLHSTPPIHIHPSKARSYVTDFELTDDTLIVQFEKGNSSNFHHLWLRDNCRCKDCFHAYTKQRLLSTFDIPLNIKPHGVKLEADGILISWSDGHETFVPTTFLLNNSYDPPLIGPKVAEKDLWDQSLISSMPSVEYQDLMVSDGGSWSTSSELSVLRWLQKIERFGFCLVNGVPPNPESTEKLLRRIAFIRETHYGAFWDFTGDMEHGDTAYTNLALQAHTDTTYFSDPAGLQLFHLLSPPTSHVGGSSLLVDGFAAAAKLKAECTEAYQVLSTMPVETHASGGDGVAFRPILPQPVLSHHPRTGELMIVRWNPDDRKPIWGRSGEEVKRWYRSIRQWEMILKSREMELWMQMEMGQALIFDNQRVLHGRSSYTGSRRVCGGYINGDDYRSRLRSLTHKFSNNCTAAARSSDVSKPGVWNDID